MFDIYGLLNKALNPHAVNYEQVIIDNTAGGVALDAIKYDGAFRAVIVVSSAAIRYRIDGKGAPTTASGMYADVGDTIILESFEDMQHFRAIRTTTTSATIDVTYFN